MHGQKRTEQSFLRPPLVSGTLNLRLKIEGSGFKMGFCFRVGGWTVSF